MKKSEGNIPMTLPNGGTVVLPYEVHIGEESGMYHIEARSGTDFYYTKEEITAKLQAGNKLKTEKQTPVTVADLLK
jgi:hypothetical protein|tara:strand:+ start:1480 stop:1707 length:228 start_codon:yes stop_codon:yes gene_type:complete